MGMTLSMEEKVQTAAETVINASAADETVTGGTTPSEPLSEKRIVHAEDFDPLFAMSEEDCVEGFIKREMQRAGITEEQNLIPEDMLRKAATMAVCKINIDSDLRLAFTASVRKHFNEHPDHFDPRQYLTDARSAIKGLVEHKIVDVLGCNGKA